jgi:hypothetical protein
MTHFTRREFLRKLASSSAALASGWLLSACGRQGIPAPAASIPPTPTASLPLIETVPSPTNTPPSPTTGADQAGVSTLASETEPSPTPTTGETSPPTAAPDLRNSCARDWLP